MDGNRDMNFITDRIIYNHTNFHVFSHQNSWITIKLWTEPTPKICALSGILSNYEYYRLLIIFVNAERKFVFMIVILKNLYLQNWGMR
jgi:hypothetical protein